jgi:maleylpyruvate isomerase
MDESELRARLEDIEEAEGKLRTTMGELSDADLGAPSLCDGWTRGHVLAHLALNAHSIVNLIEWARTGVETPQYASRAERAADIERYSSRTVHEHRRAFDEAGAAFFAAARSLPLDRWDFSVSGIASDPMPVSVYLFGRLREVEVHHFDLDTGYGPDGWSDAFVRRALEGVPGRFEDRVEEPFEIHATDLDERHAIGDGAPVLTVSGPGRALLLWFLRGRAEGLDAGGGDLPVLPGWG